MTQEIVGSRIHDALSAFETPPYPFQSIAARIAAGAGTRALPRRRALTGAFAALALAIVAAGSAAFAVPSVLPEKTLRLLDIIGVHLGGRTILALETRQVTLAEARSQADFPVVVPLGVRIARVMLNTDRRHHTFVGLVLQDGGGLQIVLDETRSDHRLTEGKFQPAFQIDSSGRSVAPRGSWIAVGKRLVLAHPGDKPIASGPRPGVTFYALTKVAPIRWTLNGTSLVIAPYNAASRAFAERVRRGPFTDGTAAGR